MTQSTIIFPAFVSEYTGSEQEAIRRYGNGFEKLLGRGSEMLNLDLTGFDVVENNFSGDEEKSQYVSYIFSCAVADILSNQDIEPSFVSGYSMGIYAALYYCGSVSFEDGLRLVKRAWDLISEAASGGKYSMGMIVGLTDTDIQNMITDDKDVVICNQNNPHTYIISGKDEGVKSVLSMAREEGALRANLLPVTKPYHTDVLRDAIPGFTKFLDNITVKAPSYPYLSSLDQGILLTNDDLRQELIKNLYHKMDWYGAMKKMIEHGMEVFFECGAGDGLTRNFRFIDRKVKSYSVNKINDFINKTLTI